MLLEADYPMEDVDSFLLKLIKKSGSVNDLENIQPGG